MDVDSSPVLIIFYADASFSGQNTSHHPIYCYCESVNFCIAIIVVMIFVLIILIMLIISVSLLNLHEDKRSKPSAWIPVGWLPVHNEERDERPSRGYDSALARKYRLYHCCWVEFLPVDGWAEQTKESEVPLADHPAHHPRKSESDGLLCLPMEGTPGSSAYAIYVG